MRNFPLIRPECRSHSRLPPAFSLKSRFSGITSLIRACGSKQASRVPSLSTLIELICAEVERGGYSFVLSGLYICPLSLFLSLCICKKERKHRGRKKWKREYPEAIQISGVADRKVAYLPTHTHTYMLRAEKSSTPCNIHRVRERARGRR